MAKIGQKQITLIHIAKNEIGLDNDTYRALLWWCGGVTSSRDLDTAGFDELMKFFEACGFRNDFVERNLGRRRDMASPSQIAFIRALWRNYTNGEGEDSSLGKWLERTFKVTSIRFIDANLAPKVITALKAMCAKKRAKAPNGGGKAA